jgi:hypothetical protein
MPVELFRAALAFFLLKLAAEEGMRYVVAWMLGVPFSIIVLWYVVGHAACGAH